MNMHLLAPAHKPGRESFPSTTALKVRVDNKIQCFSGRFAWALHRLILAGPAGITSVEQPAPRLAHYIFRLRRDGISIETVTEKHDGCFAGTHARYVLRSAVEILELKEAA